MPGWTSSRTSSPTGPAVSYAEEISARLDRLDGRNCKPQEIITYIVRRLRELLGTNGRGFRDYMALEILSKNRDFQAQIKEAEHMLTEIDLESLPSFAIGFERGEEKGREEGEAQVVSRLLSRLGVAEVFGLLGLAPEEVERIAAAGGDDDSGCNRLDGRPGTA